MGILLEAAYHVDLSASIHNGWELVLSTATPTKIYKRAVLPDSTTISRPGKVSGSFTPLGLHSFQHRKSS